MVDGTGLGTLAELMDSAGEYIEYWREHKGERIVIRETNVTRYDGTKIRQTSHITRGTVVNVLSLPPGFVLEDVEEVVAISDLSMSFGIGSSEVQDVMPTSEGEQIVREVEEKFVSFSAIEELEKAEDAENAEEPFRE